ncbi:rhomboid family intramembrane serine protease [Pseudomonas matsuisoli]|uniref:Rhomboid family intramembrane serine protease n=1 Tax=Pseudomonas matsuisoli TaxID=1515666 RepID=A0A917UVS0_9PSED|nr:rhomboid family intramembrane serine protease [Pseudomonas matsuisoli]GGJ90029.1 rhomboid family intramembrane serine protease [Pseudomonas matsuisoli]
MRSVEAFRVALDVDLRDFVKLLRALRVPHRVVEAGDAQILLVTDEQVAQEVRTLYATHPNGADPAGVVVPDALQAHVGRGKATDQLRNHPMTAAVLLLTFAVAVFTGFGDQFSTIRYLSFLDFRIQGQYLYFAPIDHTLNSQWWRLLTPMFLHFGFLHLAMNGLWFWELGKRVEKWHNASILVALTLSIGLLSNVAQYLYTGPSLFGGLSGVLYGLLGYCWIYQKLAPNPVFRLPPGVVAMMLVWLVVCMSGLVSALGFGAIANAAHVSGLIAGCACGAIGGLIGRRGQGSAKRDDR